MPHFKEIITSLQDAFSQNSIQEVQRLIDNGVDVNEVSLDFEGIPLHVASYKGHETIARLLELISRIGDIKFFCNVLKAMYIL